MPLLNFPRWRRLLVIGVFITLLGRLLSKPLFDELVRLWFRAVLLVIGVRCRYVGEPIKDVSSCDQQTILSWADVLVVGARWPMTFSGHGAGPVPGPLVGWLAERAGTLFIEQGRGRSSGY